MEERQTKSGDGTVQFKRSTSLSDGNGSWQLAEVREGTRKIENGQEQSKDERILRPDANGDLAVVERTVSRKTEPASGEKRETVDTYSQSVPGASGDGSLQLVQRQTTVHRDTSSGAQTTVHQVEQVNPASPSEGVRLTGQTIDIVRPDSSGKAQQQTTVITLDSDGRQSAVWVDVGKTDNPAVIKIDTGAAPQTPPTAKPH
jgi:hypothetical protein